MGGVPFKIRKGWGLGLKEGDTVDTSLDHVFVLKHKPNVIACNFGTYYIITVTTCTNFLFGMCLSGLHVNYNKFKAFHISSNPPFLQTRLILQ